jgi:signal transduction histidine kinase
MPAVQSKRSYIKSSSFAMAVFFTVFCGMAALSLGYFINYFTQGHFVDSTEAVLDSQMTLVKKAGLPQQGMVGDYVYLYLDSDGSFPETIQSYERLSQNTEGILVFRYLESGNRYAGKIYSMEAGQKLLIGFDITEISNQFYFMQILGVSSIIFVMLVVFASYIISVFVVSGTNKIAETAQDIIHTGDLSRRLEFHSRWDDLSNMANVLNSLLARIETLMTGVRQVSDNIAHDLRTPLTRMRNHIEDLQKKYGHNDYDELLNEADHLLDTFTALLRVSRIETEQQKSHFKTVDLDHIIRDVIEFYTPLIEDKDIAVTLDTTPAELRGDKDLLFQAYANLLDNAIKFTPQNGNIAIALLSKNDGIILTIADSGIGVDSDDIDKIFGRFYRTEKSRTTKGTGLGLSLVKAVIELHGGRIHAEPNKPGLRMVTKF